MSQDVMSYRIGKTDFEQKKLVLGQIRQLTRVMQGLQIPVDADARQLVTIIGDRLPMAMAVVLTRQGESPAGKNLEELAKEIEFSIDLETTIKVVEDFFDCNPVTSVLSKLTKVMGNMINQMRETGSNLSASSSPEETLQNEEQSSGDAQPTK